jgi:hypothetical protein
MYSKAEKHNIIKVENIECNLSSQFWSAIKNATFCTSIEKRLLL